MNFFSKLTVIIFLSMSFYSLYTAPLCISLGNSCAGALNLRNLGIRHVAFPFDWIVSPFEAIYNVLNDDFRYFLDDLRPRPDQGGLIDHYGFHFTHDWPNNHSPQVQIYNEDLLPNGTIFGSWKDAIPAVKQKYQRRIDRFRHACTSGEKIFFIRFEEYDLERHKELATLLRDVIELRYPKANFELLLFSTNPKNSTPWNMTRVKNFYVPDWNNPGLWAATLRQVGPEFRNIKISKNNMQSFAEQGFSKLDGEIVFCIPESD